MPEQRLDLGPRPCPDVPYHRAALADEDLLLRLGLDEDRGAHDLFLHLLELDGNRVRHLVARQPERLLADQLGELQVDREVGALLLREVERSLRQQPDELVPELRDSVAGLRAHRVERVEVPEPRRGVHLRRDVSRLEPVDLVERDHDGHAEPEHARGDEAVAGSDPLPRGEDEEDGLHFLEGGVDRLLHPLGELVERPLEARQVCECELVVVAVRDPEDAPPRRLRLVGDDRDLAAAQGIDESGLPDVRPSGDGDDSRPHRSSPIHGARRPQSVTWSRCLRPPIFS